MNRFAEEKWKNRFTTAAKENYNEMGLLTFSVVFYTLKNGQQAVDMYVYSSCSGVIRSLSQVFSHDNVSELLGIPCKSFRKMHEDRPPKLCETWSRISRQYAPVPEPDQLQERELTIELNPDGFPIAPDPASLEKTTKADLETLYRRYITSHYCKLSKMHFSMTRSEC